MHTVSIEVENSKDLQLLVQLVKRLGLKIVDKQPKSVTSNKQLETHLEIIANGGQLSDQKMDDMLNNLKENRNDDSRSSRPE